MSVSENIVQTGGDDILKKWNKFGVSDDSNSFGKYSIYFIKNDNKYKKYLHENILWSVEIIFLDDLVVES